MKTMTSLEAQNRFGELIDTSQREPVLITRRGRPVSIVIAPPQTQAGALVQFMRVMRALAPLDGEAAVAEIERATASAAKRSRSARLSEAALRRLVDESR